jgi:hypothetical protein
MLWHENWRITSGRALVALLLIVCLGAGGTSTYTVFEAVEFTVPMDWPVVKKKSELARSLFIFEIPNPATEGTPDSTTLAVEAFDLKDPDAKGAFDANPLPEGRNVQSRKFAEGWDCSSYVTMHDLTTYDVWACRRTLNNGGVFIHLTWPHLQGNPPDYAKQMRSTLTGVLKSVAPAAPASEPGK